MIKNLCIFLLLALSLQNASSNVIKINEDPVIPLSSKWTEHLMDFAALVDVDKVVTVALGYLNDPEVMRFISFVLSNDFKENVWDFENIDEFVEASAYLSAKGYDVVSVIDYVNKVLELPPFNSAIEKTDAVARGTGMKGFIDDMLAILPIEDFKKLFEEKLKTSPEVADLFDTINSPEFLDIMKRLGKNPKFIEIKKTFEGYEFDFKYLCQLAKDIFGNYYQGVFCDELA